MWYEPCHRGATEDDNSRVQLWAKQESIEGKIDVRCQHRDESMAKAMHERCFQDGKHVRFTLQWPHVIHRIRARLEMVCLLLLVCLLLIAMIRTINGYAVVLRFAWVLRYEQVLLLSIAYIRFSLISIIDVPDPGFRSNPADVVSKEQIGRIWGTRATVQATSC